MMKAHWWTISTAAVILIILEWWKYFTDWKSFSAESHESFQAAQGEWEGNFQQIIIQLKAIELKLKYQ